MWRCAAGPGRPAAPIRRGRRSRTPTNRALATLTQSAISTAIITQNIDGLHQRAGTPAGDVIELHGTMFRVVCLSCGDNSAMADAVTRVAAGEDDPRCTRCGGTLKATTILFGERLDPAVLDRAERATLGCDLFLAVGSTLTVMPAAALCELAVESGAALVVVNRDPTPYDEMAEAVIRVPIGVAVPRIVGQLMRSWRPS
jgi:NAD-dependent deacetylase